MFKFKLDDANEHDEFIPDLGTSAEGATEAEKFLKLLDPKALEFTFQARPDSQWLCQPPTCVCGFGVVFVAGLHNVAHHTLPLLIAFAGKRQPAVFNTFGKPIPLPTQPFVTKI
jgi:hypothetical protein